MNKLVKHLHDEDVKDITGGAAMTPVTNNPPANPIAAFLKGLAKKIENGLENLLAKLTGQNKINGNYQ